MSVGTVHWVGVYGHNWYVDRKSGISIAILTNTALRGMSGDLKDQVLGAVYKAFPKK